MKKLMIAAAIVCAAVIAQAGAVKWQWTAQIANGYLNTDNTKTSWTGRAPQGGTMYIFNANATYEEGKYITQQYILTSILGGAELSSLGAMDSYTTANGVMATTKQLEADYQDFAPVREGTGADAGKLYADYFYAMLVKDADDNQYLFLSQTFPTLIQESLTDTKLAGNIATDATKNWGDTTTFVNAGWYAAAPEPTSGLLLLLGVAGLALRRRRA